MLKTLVKQIIRKGAWAAKKKAITQVLNPDANAMASRNTAVSRPKK